MLLASVSSWDWNFARCGGVKYLPAVQQEHCQEPGRAALHWLGFLHLLPPLKPGKGVGDASDNHLLKQNWLKYIKSPCFPCKFIFIPLTSIGLLTASAPFLGILKEASLMQQPSWVEQISFQSSCNALTSRRHACFALLWGKAKCILVCQGWLLPVSSSSDLPPKDFK